MRHRLLAASSLFAAAMLGVGATPTLASAQTHADLVWSQLKKAYEVVNPQGFSSRNYIIGRMNDDASDSWTFTLSKGTEYKIVGACDKDCDDLDVEVLEDGNSIEKDVLTDDHPVVGFSAKKTVVYTIKVTMASCKADPCFFGFALFQK